MSPHLTTQCSALSPSALVAFRSEKSAPAKSAVLRNREKTISSCVSISELILNAISSDWSFSDTSPYHSLTVWQHTGSLPCMKIFDLAIILCLGLPLSGQQVPPSGTPLNLHYALLNDTSGKTLW